MSVDQAVGLDLCDRKIQQTYRYVSFNEMIHVCSFVLKNSKMYKKGTQGTPISMESLFYNEYYFFIFKDLEDTIGPEY